MRRSSFFLLLALVAVSFALHAMTEGILPWPSWLAIEMVALPVVLFTVPAVIFATRVFSWSGAEKKDVWGLFFEDYFLAFKYQRLWRFAFTSRGRIEYALAVREFMVVPHVLLDNEKYRQWFGKDARRVYGMLAMHAHHSLVDAIDRMIANDIRDFDKLISYANVGGLDAAFLAIEQSIPVEYAAVMVPDAERMYYRPWASAQAA